jgi:hypothetical protein
MQPLDIIFLGHLRSAFDRECDCFMKSHPHQTITPYELAGIFNKTYIGIARLYFVFSNTGIYPLNP